MNRTITPAQPTSVGQAARPATPERSGDILDLTALVSTLWRGKLLIFVMAAISIAIGAYYAYLVATPQFRSTAVVMLNTREEQVVDLESVIGGLTADASTVNTEVEVLKSRSLLAKVVQELSLQDDPEFNRFLRDPSLLDTVKLTVKRGLGLTQPAPDLPEEDERVRTREATIDGLLNRLTIRNVPNSLVFQITAQTTHPKKSALVANTVVDLYILNQLEVKFEATEQATSWLTGRVTELQVSLEEAEAKVKDFRGGTDLINPESLAALEIQLKEVRDRIADTEDTRTTATARLAQIESAGTPQEQADVTGDPQLSRFLPRIATPSIRDSFDARYAQVLTRARLEVDRAVAQLAALETSRGELETRISRQSADLITLQQLTREAEASRLLYEYFLSRLKETSAQQGIQQADSRVLSNAVVPILPASPRRPLIIAMCAMLGLVLGAVLVLLREASKDTFRTAKGLEDLTGYPVMGQIATLPARRRKDAIKYLVEKPTSAAAEAVRNLRTSVLLSNVDSPPQIVLTSSSLPGEGKTTVALALAQNMSAMGKRVLLIEGDIRRRVFGEYFDAKDQPGLISVLSGEVTLDKAVIREEVTGADVLLGDRSNTNAADIFSSEAFRNLIAKVRDTYDQIIIDTPPVLVVPDARIIAQHVDAVLFIVKWDQTLKAQVTEALAMFESVNQNVSGMVLNQISPRGMRRYGYGAQYGAYSSYGRKYYEN